ncbi:squalene epoxidase 3-like [Juglans microcarpa x Juglans regia]|uniref:squalene epoxidase 3-like n=1 Tax=Juglans microcarpa x Juglans regia TaxID=2249226 RepID=UPI001B7DA59D|nr:squalene epoxidase 3-like [Juglans microcarpa x Juglans regia]
MPPESQVNSCSYKSTHSHAHLHAQTQPYLLHHRCVVISLYKASLPPKFSLVLHHKFSPPTSILLGRTRTRAGIASRVEGETEDLIQPICSSSFSSSGSHCFIPLKTMMAIDQHMLWAFFASLFGFVLLYSLGRWNCSNANKKRLKKKSFPEECAKQSFGDGESRPLEGSGTDVIIVGAGVAGAALAYTLGKDGRRVHVIERDLTEPDRIVGELLQPGGYLKLIELGLEDCVEEIDAQRVVGYALFKDGKNARLSYPLEKFHSDVAGRSFHNGRFIQRMREKATTLPNVQLEQGTVTSLLEGNGTIKGVQYKTKDGQEHKAYAPLTIVCDGCFSNLRRSLCYPKVDVPSCFVGLVLENCKLPFANHGHVILADPSPILFYPISSTEVRCLVDVPGQKLPSVANGEMANYLKTVVAPQIPAELKEAFISAVDKGNIRTMPNRSMPADPLPTPGALLMGDAFNMRHPLTGGGMTVALSDIVILRDLLKPLRDLNDAPSLSKYLESFYTLRKPVASTINTLAGALYKVFSSSPDQARKEMRQACFDYLSLGGIFSTGPVALLSGLNPRPLNLVLHFFAVAVYGVGRLLLPFPSPKGMWIGARLISSASSIIFPIIKAEGVRQMFFPATVSAYYRAPPIKQDIQKDMAEIK